MGSERFEALLARLRGGPLLWDGGLGTELQARGLEPGECPERFGARHPEVVAAIHSAYFDAGADGIETNTFGANRFCLERFGLAAEVDRFNRDAAALARSVCPPGKWVAGSMGPTGQIPEPYGTCPLAALYEAFAEQALALKEGGVDFVFVETMIDLHETVEAVKACRREAGLDVIASWTFRRVPGGFKTAMGHSVQAAQAAALECGASGLGTNCSNSIEETIAVASELRSAAGDGLPIAAMPNAGLPELVGKQVIYPETPASLTARLQALLAAGANIIGGCCGTSPSFIGAFRAKLDELVAGE